MKINDITKFALSIVNPAQLKEWVQNLLNKVEEIEDKNKKHLERIEYLEATIRRLQGLPVKPKFEIKDKTSDLDKNDDSSDDDNDDDYKNKKMKKRRSDAAKKKRRKKKNLKIDITRKIKVNSGELDATFEYKGTRKVIVQDILFQRNNIAFELEKYYSKEHGNTVEADLPEGYDGGYFGPYLLAFIRCSYYEGDVTIKKIFKILKSIDIKISEKQINRIINNKPDELVKELEDARVSAIEKLDYQQIDDTNVNVLGFESCFTTVTCNPLFTNLYTSLSKNRANVVLALCGGNKQPLYKINLQSIIVMFASQKSLKVQLIMEKHQSDQIYNKKELKELFNHKDFKNLKHQVLRDIKTAMLVGAFYDGHLGPSGSALVSDDAPQFNNLFDSHILCWYHEIRHYKDLAPVFEEHQDQLKMFFIEIKMMYKIFKKWRETRSEKLLDYIFRWFNEFFQKETGYKLLDNRKNKTYKKMEKMLAALWTTARVPLTNNESERDLRGRSIKNKKISLFDRSWEGVKARDFYISLKQTCRKNGVSFYQYLLDRSCKTGGIPQLSEIIRATPLPNIS